MLWLTVPSGLLCEAILHANNRREREREGEREGERERE